MWLSPFFFLEIWTATLGRGQRARRVTVICSSHLLRQMPPLSGLVFDIKCTLKEKVIQWPTIPLLLPPIAPENSSLFVAGVREACQHV